MKYTIIIIIIIIIIIALLRYQTTEHYVPEIQALTDRELAYAHRYGRHILERGDITRRQQYDIIRKRAKHAPVNILDVPLISWTDKNLKKRM